jgi:molybdopterin-guanine dinucleotide biosynthesis protein A
VYDAILLAGGGGRRLGGVAKPQVEVGGSTLLDHAVVAVAGAARVVVAGPRQPVSADVTWCREDPPGGGPVAAIAAALPLTSAGTVVVLATDLPDIAPAVPRLLAAVPDDGAALLVDGDGRVNNLAAAWRRPALAAALARRPVVHGAAVRSLLAGVTVVLVPDDGGWGRDCDTWADVAAARTAFTSTAPTDPNPKDR